MFDSIFVCHCFLSTLHRLILVIFLNALFLPFYLEDKEVRSSVSYFSTFCHICLIIIIVLSFYEYDIVFCTMGVLPSLLK